MKTTLRLSIILILVAVQALLPVSAQALTQTPSSSSSMPPALYSAFLDASAAHAANAETPGLKTSFSAAGLSVAPQNGNGWKFNLKLDGFGRQGQTAVLSAPKVGQHNGRTEFSYAAFSEWYRATGVGLEQGFTIAQKPVGKGQLVLHMQLDTGLSGALSKDSRSLSFATGNGQALHYSDLRAVDATGRDLPAALVYTKGQLVLQVNDQGAAYPITVDPLIYIESELFAADGLSGGTFGSVAISGDTAVIGAQSHLVGSNANQGVAYIFVRQGITWSQQAELTASDGAASDRFGRAVAISGDTAIVGAWGHNAVVGEAYVFVKPAGGWADSTETARLAPSDGAAGDHFGFVVAISGNTVLVGSPNRNTNLGEAYVFVKPAGGWATYTQTATQTAILTASDGAANDYFGYSLGISKDTIVIAAFGHAGKGAAYIFLKPGGGWTDVSLAASLTASDGVASDNFGRSADISGDTVVIGAPMRSGHQGQVYVFVKPFYGWGNSYETARLTALDGVAGDLFGWGLAIDGDCVLVGAIDHNLNRGEAYVFVKPAGGWVNGTQTSTLNASDAGVGDQLGTPVAISGDTAIVGAMGHNSTGAAYVYFPYRGEDLYVTAASSSLSPQVGQTLILTANVTNLSSSTASPAVMLNVPLPTGFSLVNSAASLGSYNSVTGYWNVGTLGADVTATLDLVVTVGSGAIGTTPVFNVALLGWDSYYLNNTASVTMNPLVLLAMSPAALTFADQTVGTLSPLQTVTVTNLSATSVTLGSLSAPAGFQLSVDTCTAATLLPSAACIFSLQFMPAAAGAFHGSVTIPLTSPAWSVSVPVSGAGLPVLTFGTLGLNFPNTFVQSASAPRTVKITNLSAGIASLGTLVAPPGFLLSANTCNAKKLPASGGSCTFAVQFKPLSAISYAAGITVPIASSSSSMTLPVSGTGLPLLSFSPTPVTFAPQLIPTTSPAQTVTVTNISPGSLTLGTLVAPAGFPISANNCSKKVLVASGTCTFAVQFTPPGLGPIASSIAIPIAKPVTTMSLSVSGTGSAGSQLLTNTSFEAAAAPPLPDGWTNPVGWAAADGRDCTTAHTGSCSLKFTGTNAAKSLTFAFSKSGVAGDDFLFTLWRKNSSVPKTAAAGMRVMATTTATLNATIQVYNSGPLVATYMLPMPGGTYPFTQGSLPFTVTVPTYTNLVVTILYNGSAGTVWFDDASLVWAP